MAEEKRLRGFDIHPADAQDWPDEFVDKYLSDLEQQGRLEGRDQAIQLLAEQGRGPAAEEAKPKRRTAKAAEEEAE